MSIKYVCDKCGQEIVGKKVELIEENQLKHYCADNCFTNARRELEPVITPKE